MKFVVFSLVLLCTVLLSEAVVAQRVMLLEKPGTFKNFKYFEGDDIMLKKRSTGSKIEGVIHEISDTSILVNYDNEVMLDDIQVIMKSRWGFSLLSPATRIAGAGYLALDVVNHAINNETLIDENTLIISGSLIAFSYAIVPLKKRRMKLDKNWRIKILNFSMEMDTVNPFLR